MIHVTARVALKPGKAPLFLREFREVAPLVRQEHGCLDYFPTMDVPMDLAGQKVDPDAVTILEKWTDRDALESHLRSGHMRSFQERIDGIIRSVSLHIVEEV